MGAILLILIVGGALVLGGTRKGAPLGVVAQYIPPKPAELEDVLQGQFIDPNTPEPQRIAVPDLVWHKLSGQARVEAMAKYPRFDAADPGYKTIELATLIHTDVALRIIADIVVTDATIPTTPPIAAATAVLWWSSAHTLDQIEGVIPKGATQWAERLVRKFDAMHGDLVGAQQYDAAIPLPVQDGRTVNPPLYMGSGCKGYKEPKRPKGAKIPDVFWQLGIQIGMALTEEDLAISLYDHGSCLPIKGVAYESRDATDGSGKYPRIYNLRLVPKGDAVTLVAEIARLPLVQVLDWVVNFAVTPGGHFL